MSFTHPPVTPASLDITTTSDAGGPLHRPRPQVRTGTLRAADRRRSAEAGYQHDHLNVSPGRHDRRPAGAGWSHDPCHWRANNEATHRSPSPASTPAHAPGRAKPRAPVRFPKQTVRARRIGGGAGEDHLGIKVARIFEHQRVCRDARPR
jgi:hypothetical protein